MPDPTTPNPPSAAPTTAAPDASGGHTAILGRAWTEDGDITGAVWYAEPLPEVLLVDPAVAQVLAAARQWARAWDADPFGPATSAAKARLAAAVDAAEGRGRVVADDDLPEWERELLERQDQDLADAEGRAERAEWRCIELQAELQWARQAASAATLTIPDSPKMLRETLCAAAAAVGQRTTDLGRKASDIARLQKLIDQIDQHRPLGPDGKHGDRHTPTCGCEDKPDEAAPEPAGDGPRWERDGIEDAKGRLPGDLAAQVDALLADRDQLERDLEHARADRQDLWDTRDKCNHRWMEADMERIERDAAADRQRADAAEAERDRLRAEHMLIPKDGIVGYRVMAADGSLTVAPEDVEIVLRGDLGQGSDE